MGSWWAPAAEDRREATRREPDIAAVEPLVADGVRERRHREAPLGAHRQGHVGGDRDAHRPPAAGPSGRTRGPRSPGRRSSARPLRHLAAPAARLVDDGQGVRAGGHRPDAACACTPTVSTNRFARPSSSSLSGWRVYDGDGRANLAGQVRPGERISLARPRAHAAPAPHTSAPTDAVAPGARRRRARHPRRAPPGRARRLASAAAS
jgi:hypothetical protein